MTRHSPAVSILMTCHNREAYIADAIESVLASSYPDWELIIADDQSSDGSFEIARDYAAKDARIQAHRNEENLGDYPNRNHAASLASGKYLKYLDSDDLIYAHGLQVMVDAMERFPDAALGVCCGRPEDPKPYPYLSSPEETFRAEFLGKGVLGCGPSGAIIRRDAFEEVGGFQVARFLGDRDMWYRLAMRWPITVMPPALIWWRQHEGQEISAAGSETYYLQAGFELNMRVLDGERCPLPSDECKAAVRRQKQHHARKLLALALRKRRPRTAWKLFRESGLSIAELLTGLRRYS
jgi:glycosyltransferase involved in cell wall biosynthesis